MCHPPRSINGDLRFTYPLDQKPTKAVCHKDDGTLNSGDQRELYLQVYPVDLTSSLRVLSSLTMKSFACFRMLFLLFCPKKPITSALYPYVQMLQSGSTSGRRAAGQHTVFF